MEEMVRVRDDTRVGDNIKGGMVRVVKDDNTLALTET
jgi:hypothetical protein